MEFHLFPKIPQALEDKIISQIPFNEIVCTLRLLSKAAAAHFPGHGHAVVSLSKPIPHHAFKWKYAHGLPVWRSLTIVKRRKLLCHIAASGDLANLDLAVSASGLLLSGERTSILVLDAAAHAGHGYVCHWLRNHGCVWNQDSVLMAACAAYRGGHLSLARYLESELHSFGPETEMWPIYYRLELRNAAVEGCSLQELQDLWQIMGLQPSKPGCIQAASEASAALAAAARSPSPDWRTKLVWLEAQLPRPVYKSPEACQAAAALPDAVERLRWLQQRGYPADNNAALSAAQAGNMEALQYLLEQPQCRGGRHPEFHLHPGNPPNATKGGHLAALQALHAAGYQLTKDDAYTAATQGHLLVVQWLYEQLNVANNSALQRSFLFDALESADVELIDWLLAQGCTWQKCMFYSAALSGNQDLLEQVAGLAEMDCPIQQKHDSYFLEPAVDGDMATLQTLHHLGWRPEPSDFNLCVSEAPLPCLRWMVEQGCLVDWTQALQAAEQRDRAEIVSWIRSVGRL